MARPRGSLDTDDHSRPICLEFRILSSPFLKLFKVADVTVLSSRAFQMLMIRSAKKCFLRSVLNLCLHNFLECGPCVLSLVAYRIQRNGQSWFQKYYSQFYKFQSNLHGVYLPSSINVILSAPACKADSLIREPCMTACELVLEPFQNIFIFTVMRTPSCSAIFQMQSNKFDQYILFLKHYRSVNNTKYFISFIKCL